MWAYIAANWAGSGIFTGNETVDKSWRKKHELFFGLYYMLILPNPSELIGKHLIVQMDGELGVSCKNIP